LVEIVFVKAAGPGERDRVYWGGGDGGRLLPVHPVHDLPHLAVESVLGIGDGLWGELAGGVHAETAAAVTARDPKRQKHGRIVSGAAGGQPTDRWLSSGHRLAKAITNAVANRWGDGPDTPAGVRERFGRTAGVDATVLDRIGDDAIALAIRAVRDLGRRWAETPPGGTLRLVWPLPATWWDRPGGPGA
jgi:hypothetical protein